MEPFSTPITQHLDKRGVAYRVLHHDTPATTVEDAAKQRGIQSSQMVKCIAFKDMGGLLALACVPGDRSADPKKVRAILSCRRMTCLSKEEVEQVTGYSIGTVTPLLLGSTMEIFIDPVLKTAPFVTISSGNNMAGVALDLQDLVELCNARWASICRD
ncbi:aminoacyl-tRNA deacylase [Vibrio maerlii]|uniref:aminoacyl-tRNA deacylase n=1 Tax=Vibrio maerlii TaxID=2231648 RepID=UPI000E3CCCB5|nr:YbaK/EbsC family protein [Vibrio maerlii]